MTLMTAQMETWISPETCLTPSCPACLSSVLLTSLNSHLQWTVTDTEDPQLATKVQKVRDYKMLIPKGNIYLTTATLGNDCKERAETVSEPEGKAPQGKLLWTRQSAAHWNFSTVRARNTGTSPSPIR